MSLDSLYHDLRDALKEQVRKGDVWGQNIRIRCGALSSRQAIGRPEHEDYPIIKGKEVMIEAEFENAKGQAFTDEFENGDYRVEDLLNIGYDNNRKRATFIASLNAIYRYFRLIDTSIHCRDREPVECANKIPDMILPGIKVLLVGYQPRFLEILASRYHVRAVDLDPDNINKSVFNTKIESSEMTNDGIQWCDMIFATGSSVVNGTIDSFIESEKPTVFYGVTIAAAAKILNLDTYCKYGH